MRKRLKVKGGWTFPRFEKAQDKSNAEDTENSEGYRKKIN
jgi:hypothetical protein